MGTVQCCDSRSDLTRGIEEKIQKPHRTLPATVIDSQRGSEIKEL